MRRFLILSAAVVCLALANRAAAQPKPYNATPNDYVAPQAEEIPQQETLPLTPPTFSNSEPALMQAGGGPQLPPENSPNADSWRYVFYRGRWWYRQPAGRWSYWTAGHWVDYVAPGRSNAPSYVQPPPAPRRWRSSARPPYYR